VEGIPCGITHFYILEGLHLMPMGIKVQVSVDLEFFADRIRKSASHIY
jgi:hypothetical protein